MNIQTITIKEYLSQKSIDFKESNGELIAKCFFNGCDDDSGGSEAHLYFNIETGQYDCKKCGEKGNLTTLAKHFGDSMDNPPKSTKNNLRRLKIDASMVEQCHQAMPARIREYLNARGITDELVDEYKLGWGEFYGKWWITIPITDKDGKYTFFKLRQDPENTENSNKYMFYPVGNEATIYGWESLRGSRSTLVICEGEFDRLILSKFAVPAITSTAGAGTFKKEWLEELKGFDDIHIAFDKDDAGEKASEKLIELLAETFPETSIHKITFPERMTDGKDISDYFNRYEGNLDEFIFELSKWTAGAEPIDEGKFKPITADELSDILGLTIKQDVNNKIVAFLCQLSAYTESAQFNISFNAPSSTGKSYIPMEVARLFPEKDVWELAQCSPTAFFHDFGEWDEKRKVSVVDLSRKIIIFLDQPHNDLLARLRPILSHDKKEILSKITDKSQKHGMRTKNILIKGFPAVIFCTAGLRIDEQEGTRFILLSPETSQEKLREGITEKIKKEVDPEAYKLWLESNPERKLLKERIKAIARAKIRDVKIGSQDELERIFLKEKTMLKPRHQRDIGRLINIIKTFTILNFWFREREGDVIFTSESDIREGVTLWQKMAESQDYNLPPFVYNLFKEIILTAWENKEGGGLTGIKPGLTRQEIIKKHYEVYRRPLPDWLLRQQILPMLESAGLISQEKDPTDARKYLIYPTLQLTTSPENNSEQDCGVPV
jgi:5S rRNA maturation endonuclease (ribonuclease M5)